MTPTLALVPVLLSIGPAMLRDADDARPKLSGPEETVDREPFRLHFTREGVDAPPATDGDTNGLPDLIDVVLKALPEADRGFREEGWRPLIGDAGVEGSDAIDVYVRDLPVYGYATPVPASGDDGWSCFLEIDRGATIAGQVAASVATHELHHCVEFRYRADTATWLYEAAATYEQYSHVADPVLEYASGVLYVERLSAPERRLAAVDGRFEYAAFLWMKYWSERGGFRPERLPQLWEALAGGESWQEALGREGEDRFGTDLGGTFLEFATWNAFACANDVGEHYRSDLIPCIAQQSVPQTEWAGEPIDLQHAAGPFTAAYLSLPTTAARTAAVCAGQAGLRVAGVALDRDGRPAARAVDLNGEVELATVDGGELRLVVVGTDEPLDATCVQVPAVGSISGCATAPGRGSVWPIWPLLLGFLLRVRARA
jgi:hypothetical protein